MNASALLLVLAAMSAATDDDGEVTQLARVEVVGSHIARVDVEASQPLFVLERADLDRTGLTTVGDILQHVVQNGEVLNSAVNNGGDGSIRVNLRNLGSNRTLVLVDGRRWVTLLDGSIDLTQVPLAIVDRIEVLNDGASAIYGSDAIAGVVNIITRKRYEGRELHAYYGGYEQGDGVTQSYDVTIGRTWGRFSGVLDVAYARQDAIGAGDRAISAVPIYGLPANDLCGGAAASTPNGRFRVPGLDNGAPYRCTGAPLGRTLIEGRSGTSPDDFRLFDGATDGYDFAPANYLLTPQERTSAYAQAGVELGARTTWRTRALFNRRHSEQLLAPAPLSINPAYAGILGNVGIAADNLYNPFDVTITRFARRFVESGGRRIAQEVDTTFVSSGLEGVLDVGARSFAWDATLSHGRSDAGKRSGGALDLQHVANALGPSFLDAQGTPRCGVPGEVIPDCVPLNVFGGAGSITAPMAEYIAANARDVTRLSHRGVSANLTGDLLELPAGPVGFAIGYEYRRERGEDRPDPLSQSGALGGLNNHESTEGSYSANEGYVEISVPLLREPRLARVLELSIAARFSDYSNFGATTNAEAGLRWKPHEDLLVRGNWSQAFRVPTVTELYLGIETGGTSGAADLDDPCASRAQPNAATLARCAAAGVPLQFEEPDFTNVGFGGNPALQPETAVTRTLGFVWSPSMLSGFDLGVDWYRVEIDDEIGGLDPQVIVNRCYVLGEPFSCARVTRNDEHQLYIVNATNQNLPHGFETEGYDIAASWRYAGASGKWRARLDGAYVDYYGDKGRPARQTRLADGTQLQGNSVGTRTGFDLFGAEWRFKANLELAWSRGSWSASATTRYLSGFQESCQFVVDTADVLGRPELRDFCSDPDRIIDYDGDGIGDPAAEDEVGSVWYFDMQAGWDTPWRGSAHVGVRNLFDRQPPISRAAFANSFHPDYDIPGRFLYVSYVQSF